MSRSGVVVILCGLILLVSGSPAAAQAMRGWEHYLPGTIAAVIQSNDSTIRADHQHLPSVVISGNKFPTLARATYCGSSRPLDEKRRQVLRTWGLSFYRDTSIVLDFRREYLFQEGKLQIWLPVQDAVASFFAGELKPGHQVSLYVSWAGALYAGKDITWAFLVNAYQAGEAGPPCEVKVVKTESSSSPPG